MPQPLPIPPSYTADFPVLELQRLQLVVYHLRRAIADAGFLHSSHEAWGQVKLAEDLLAAKGSEDRAKTLIGSLQAHIEDLQHDEVRIAWVWSYENPYFRERKLVEGKRAINDEPTFNPNFICWVN